jgi:hypothetical protein
MSLVISSSLSHLAVGCGNAQPSHFRHEIEERIDDYSRKAGIDDAGILDPAHMVAAE